MRHHFFGLVLAGGVVLAQAAVAQVPVPGSGRNPYAGQVTTTGPAGVYSYGINGYGNPYYPNYVPPFVGPTTYRSGYIAYDGFVGPAAPGSRWYGTKSYLPWPAAFEYPPYGYSPYLGLGGAGVVATSPW